MSWLGKNQEFHEVLVAPRGVHHNPKSIRIDSPTTNPRAPTVGGRQWVTDPKN